MNQSFDDSNMDLDIDSLSEPMGFAYGGEVEAMHLTPYGETNQESMDYQDAHSMPPMYAQGGDVEIGDYSIPRFRDRTASQMLQAFADGGAVQGRPLGGMFDLGIGNPADRGMSAGQAYALAPGNQGQAAYNASIAKTVTENIHKTPSNISSIAQKYGVSPGDINTALGQTLESRFRQEPSYQTTMVDGKPKDLFGPATMLTGGTGTGANFAAPIVTSRPRTLIDATPTLSASQQHARNLVTGDTALNDAFARTGLAKDPATYYDWQQRMTSGTTTPDQLKAQFDPIAYDIRVKEAYKNIGREGMGNDLSAFHPTSMGEMFKAYMNQNATPEDVARITNQYSGSYGTNWNADTANKARAEVIIPSLQAQDYYKRNSDVSAAFEAALKANPNQDYVGFAKNHYNTYGKREGRTWNDNITVGEYKAPAAEDFKTIDPGGYNWWLSQLKEGKISGADFDKMFYGATATYGGPYKDMYKDSMDKANEIIKARGLSVNMGTQRLPGVTGYQYPNQNALVDSINALYQTNLSRDAEPGGMTFWLNQFGADGKISPEEATLFKQSAQAERTARKMAQGGYVKKPEGAASYRMAAPVRLALGGSISRSPFRSQNEDSDYAKFIMKQQETGGPTQFAEPPPAPKTVSDLYRDVLGRAPDEGGAAYWAERFGNEVDPEETALFTQAAQPEIAARAPAQEPAAPAYTGIFGGMGVRGRSSSIPNPAGNSIFNRYGIQPNATNTDGQGGGGGSGGDNKLANAAVNAGLSYVIGPTYDYANAARQLVQGNIPGAIGSAISGATGGVSNVFKKLKFADGGEVEDPQMMADKTTELQGYKTTQPEGTGTVRGPDVPASRSAKELAAYIQAMNPAVKTETVNLGFGTRGNMVPSSPDTLNLNFRLTPGEREITTLHELEHSMDARGGDIYGRPKFAKLGGMDNNYRAYSLMGEDWRPIAETVKNMVDNREKLEKFFGRPVDNAYFQKESYDALKKRGGTEAMFSEQLASLSALEQTTGKFLTQDPEMRQLFPSTKMMAVYDALTGPRQTRMDARDLPPHTPVPSYTYEQNPAMRFIKKSMTGENEYGSPRRPFPIKRAEGSPETGEVTEAPEPRPNSAADTLKKLGLSVARGAPQIVTGAVDLAALPFTATGMIKPEDVVLSTEYLTKKGFLPPAQKGVANETMELISSSVNPAGAVKGSAAAALGMMKNAAGKTLSKQLELPLEQATKGAAESPTIRAYTGHTREIVGPYDVDRASKSADMGPGLYLTDDAEYASRSATKRVDRLPGNDVSPAVYPVDIEKSKILMHDKQYPREVLDKLRKFSRKVEDTPGSTVSGEYIYEQIRKANIPKTMMPGVFKLMGFQGAEFLPGGVSGGKSYVVYDTADTAKGAYTKKKFKDGGEATADFIKKSSKRR